jgi:hypothetical protein
MVHESADAHKLSIFFTLPQGKATSAIKRKSKSIAIGWGKVDIKNTWQLNLKKTSKRLVH